MITTTTTKTTTGAQIRKLVLELNQLRLDRQTSDLREREILEELLRLSRQGGGA